jgi:hypothetical protein
MGVKIRPKRTVVKSKAKSKATKRKQSAKSKTSYADGETEKRRYTTRKKDGKGKMVTKSIKRNKKGKVTSRTRKVTKY